MDSSIDDMTVLFPQSAEGVCLPHFLYGTAWKEHETQRLVELAIEQGFRIDTANQRRHYDEAAVGQCNRSNFVYRLIKSDGRPFSFCLRWNKPRSRTRPTILERGRSDANAFKR